MAPTAKRSTVLRSLPVLLALLLLAFFAAPVSGGHTPGQAFGHAGGSVTHSAVEHHVAPAEAPAASTRMPQVLTGTAAGSRVPQAVRALRAQLTAGVTASRAPPAAA